MSYQVGDASKWFVNHGDKVGAFITTILSLAQAQELFPGQVLKWATLGAAVATLAHTVFVQQPADKGNKGNG